MNNLKISGLYDEFPRRYGKSTIVYNKDELLSLIHRDNGYTDVFISVYSYNNVINNNGKLKLDSSSANINKIFMDADFKTYIDYSVGYKKFFINIEKNNIKKQKQYKIIQKVISRKLLSEKERYYINKCYEKFMTPEAEKELYFDILKLESHLNSKKLLRVWVFSGGGFHLYLYIKNKPVNKKYFCKRVLVYLNNIVYKNNKEKIVDDKGKTREKTIYDHYCPLKLSQLARIIGTYNPKRKSYCISLTREQLLSGLDNIKELAKKSQKKVNYIGNNLILFDNSFDSEEEDHNCSILIDNTNIEISDDVFDTLENSGILKQEIPPCIRKLLLKDQDLGYNERYLLITFLYRCGLPKPEIIEVLKLTLSAKKLFHVCGVIKDGYIPSPIERSRVETQIQNIISNDYYISCEQLIDADLCSKICMTKDPLHYFI